MTHSKLEVIIAKAIEAGLKGLDADNVNHLLAVHGMEWHLAPLSRQQSEYSELVGVYATNVDRWLTSNGEDIPHVFWNPLNDTNQAIELCKKLGASQVIEGQPVSYCYELRANRGQDKWVSYYLDFMEQGQPALQCLRYLYTIGAIPDKELQDEVSDDDAAQEGVCSDDN